jgi:PAS domain S-box-containing protein
LDQRVKLSLERKIVLGFAAALGVLLIATIAAWWNVARFRSTHYWVEHTREVLSRLEQTSSEVLGMQASTRGFVLTGSDDVLLPFHAGSTQLILSLAELRSLLADNPRQLERLARLEPLAARAREIMNGQIAARRERGLQAAEETDAYLEGQRIVDAFRQVVRQMVAEERRLLDNRLGRVNRFGRWTVFTLIAANAVAIGFVVVAGRRVRRDLRLRRDAESALQRSFARVEDLYNRAPCGYHSLDESGRFVAINDTALQWLGYQREEVVGRMNFADILSTLDAERFQERFVYFKRKGSVTNVEYEWCRKDGSRFPVLLNATAIYNDTGAYVASRATVFDATERKRIEAERDRIFTLSRDLICIAGADGFLKRINPAWEHTLGHSRDELISRPFIEFVHPDDIERTHLEARRLSSGVETVGFENRFRCSDGSYRWLRWNARPAPDENLVYASAHDVTEQRAAAERIQGLNADLALRAAQLEAANRELESFSYSVSHDLRAPLRHIDGFASLLSKRAAAALDADSQRYVTIISKSARQMGALIDDLLAFSRIGRTPLRVDTVAHNQLVAEVIANGRFDTGTSIEWTIDPLPDVQADPALLRQVWANLIGNAVKYSGKIAAPRIAIGSMRDHPHHEDVFFVRDNGVGFDMEYADKLFGVFQRLHNPSEFEGTGIGLANVRRIVTRHGGRTWAESRVGEGATFYFSLPITPHTFSP